MIANVIEIFKINKLKNYKNILMVVQSTYPNDSRVRREVEILAEDNFKVYVICLQNNDQKEFEQFGDKIFVYRIQTKENDENILSYLFFSIRFLFRALLKSIEISKKIKIAILQVHNLPDYLVFSGIFLKLKKVPIILDLHDLTPELFTSKYGNSHRIIRLLTKIIEKISCSFANHIITTSDGFKNRLIERGINPSKITIIINNPSKIIHRNKPAFYNKIDRDLKIIYHGTLARRFGLHDVIEAMPLVLSKIPGTVFHMYGGGDSDYIDYLKKLIKNYNLTDSVKIFNSRIHEEIINIIQNYDIGVVPYLEDEFMQLALSTKAFEYAKLQIPMVASDLKSIKFYFDDSSVIFYNAGDTKQLANKIIYLAQTDGEMERVALNAKRRIEILTNGSIEKKYKDLINLFVSQSLRK